LSATKTTIVAALALVLTFAGGFLAGAFAHRALVMHMHPVPPGATRMLLNHLDRRLHLTATQRKQVEVILERHHARINAVTGSVRPRIHAELQAANAEIERVLTPGQRERFAEMKMRLGAMHEHPPGIE
jgi:Spy/CpxP family protein refolding chaperone